MRDPQTAARLMSREELAGQATALLSRLRAKSPRVHCITNSVAQNFTANALLALGAVPSMTLSGEEIGAFVARSDALLVNLGTFDRERREADANDHAAARVARGQRSAQDRHGQHRRHNRLPRVEAHHREGRCDLRGEEEGRVGGWVSN